MISTHMLKTTLNLLTACFLLLAPPAAAFAADVPPVWDSSKTLPKAADIPILDGVSFHVIKPYEHDGKLYVGYSNNGGNVGRKGTGRELWNNNSAELAVVPVERLRIE